jgi:hypothetical protein
MMKITLFLVSILFVFALICSASYEVDTSTPLPVNGISSLSSNDTHGNINLVENNGPSTYKALSFSPRKDWLYQLLHYFRLHNYTVANVTFYYFAWYLLDSSWTMLYLSILHLGFTFVIQVWNVIYSKILRTFYWNLYSNGASLLDLSILGFDIQGLSPAFLCVMSLQYNNAANLIAFLFFLRVVWHHVTNFAWKGFGLIGSAMSIIVLFFSYIAYYHGTKLLNFLFSIESIALRLIPFFALFTEIFSSIKDGIKHFCSQAKAALPVPLMNYVFPYWALLEFSVVIGIFDNVGLSCMFEIKRPKVDETASAFTLNAMQQYPTVDGQYVSPLNSVNTKTTVSSTSSLSDYLPNLLPMDNNVVSNAPEKSEDEKKDHEVKVDNNSSGVSVPNAENSVVATSPDTAKEELSSTSIPTLEDISKLAASDSSASFTPSIFVTISSIVTLFSCIAPFFY